MDKLLLIYNPNAGRGVIRNDLSDIIDKFCRYGYEVTVYPTTQKGDASVIIEQNAGRFDRIVCSGGDGTLNDVTDGLMKLDRKIPCGYIPAGTVNDFAKSFKLPSDISDAADVAITGSPFLCDIGEMNGDYFDYIAAFGAFTEVSYETSRFFKNILGKLAYFFEGVKRLPTIRKYKAQIQIEDMNIEDEFIFGMVTNSFSVGGFLSLFDDDVALDDGKLEAFFIKSPKNLVELQSIINALISSDVTCKYFRYYHIEEIRITFGESVSWTVDGEFGGEFEEVYIKNHTRAIPFIRGE